MITVSGPEKAGKTTLLTEVQNRLTFGGQMVFTRHWSKIDTDLDYLVALKSDIERVKRGEWVLWDRSWVCEHVYSKLLERGGRFADDPWLAQWLYGRAVDAIGTQAILLPWSILQNEQRRDATDLPVDATEEVNAYSDYARMAYIPVLFNGYRDEDLSANASFLIRRANLQWSAALAAPPQYAGRPDAKVIVVGEQRNEKSTLPGSWLPFTSPFTTAFARSLGSVAFQAGWTNAAEINPAVLRKEGRSFITCGKISTIFVSRYVNSQRSIEIPHPAYLYRWGKAKALIPEVTAKVRQYIEL